jgi:exodeoxyribonuclease-3
MKTWKIATWNVNSVKARFERLQAFLRREQPDIVCLQELKCTDDLFPIGAMADLGYHATVWGQKAYNGVAILSRQAAENAELGFGDGGENASRFVVATVGELRIASAYIPNGQAVGTDKFAYKLEWLGRLEAYLKRAGDAPFCLAGDFNVAPADIDVHDPQSWRDQVLCSEPERDAFRRILACGFHDCFRELHPQTQAYSWWDYRQLGFVKNRGLRIDFILANRALRERCCSIRIDRDERKGTGASDHAPVIAEFT